MIIFSEGYADIGQLDEAWRCIGEAMSTIETAKERWFEAEVNRIAGAIALKSPEPDAANAEEYFQRALVVARKQQAKSWELRAAMRMARLGRHQGKREEGSRARLWLQSDEVRRIRRVIEEITE